MKLLYIGAGLYSLSVTCAPINNQLNDIPKYRPNVYLQSLNHLNFNNLIDETSDNYQSRWASSLSTDSSSNNFNQQNKPDIEKEELDENPEEIEVDYSLKDNLLSKPEEQTTNTTENDEDYVDLFNSMPMLILNDSDEDLVDINVINDNNSISEDENSSDESKEIFDEWNSEDIENKEGEKIEDPNFYSFKMISDTLYKSSRLSNFSKAKPIDLVNNKNVASTLAWNANGTYLATGSLQTIRLFSCGKTSFTQSPQEITVHTNKVQAVCWHTTNPDRLSSGSKDKTVKLFDLKISFRNHTNDINMGGEVINLKWHPTRSEIVACGLVKEKEDYISFLDLRGGTTSNSEEHNNFTYKKLAADSDEVA
ncbi:hypothetical protein HK099_003094 [Clydaea vesicula]|uniref:Anaphase-promoting complex subunit 4 WD40 domain-containing protein n=1 Tax=Clydaea vesicula TaxID=447962 RepID=A0AAD5Y129_9FUNG|nr:hypothetical protein HK099_003094 [Clydaea vesicula]